MVYLNIGHSIAQGNYCNNNIKKKLNQCIVVVL